MRCQSSAMAVAGYLAFSLLCFFALSADYVDKKPPFSFSFMKFGKGCNFESQIGLYGDAEVSDSSALRLFRKGRVMVKKPIRFFGTSPGFSTYFAFAISKGVGGGLAFLLVPNNVSQISPTFVAVKFDADSSGGSISIDVGGGIFVKSSNLSADGISLVLDGEQKLHSWIDYCGVSKVIEVRISKSGDLKPENSSVSCPVDLSNVLWREAIYVGISSSSKSSAQASTVYSWSFGVTQGPPYRMHSEPLDPESVSIRSHEDLPIHVSRSSSWKLVVALFAGAVCGALTASAVFVVRSKVGKRHPIAPVECPVVHVEGGFEKIVLDGKKIEGNLAK